MASQKQIEANRRNSQLSTGPTTPTGKARTKLNGLKHGLRSKQGVLPTENPAEFQAFVDAWVTDWQPTTMARLELVEEAAVAAWRKKRCIRVESERLSKRIRRTHDRALRKHHGDLDALVARMRHDPRGAVDGLLATRGGVLRIIAIWDELAEAARDPRGWRDRDAHHRRLFHVQGCTPDDPGMAELAEVSWRLFLTNCPGAALFEAPGKTYTPEDAAAAAEAILALAAHATDSLHELADALPDDEADLARAAEARAFMPRPEDAALLRYESQLSRQFHRALGDLTKLAKSGADLVEEIAPSEANSGTEVIDEEEVATESSKGESGSKPVSEAVGEAVPSVRRPDRVGARVSGRSAAA